MATRVTGDAGEFRAVVFPFLERDPVLNTLILTNVAERADGNRPAEGGDSVFVSVHDAAGEVIGAAMRTPGRPIYLGALDERLVPELVEVYADLVPDANGVGGSRPAATAFANHWTQRTTFTETMATRLYRLDELVRLTAPGVPRPATEADIDLAASWVAVDFGREIGDNTEWAKKHVDHGTLWFWEADGEPVSMVGHHLPVFGVSRVGPVYTPTEFRRNGYAGALTAHVSGEILAAGNQACLFTDQANPTSNKIYQNAGYHPIADFVVLSFPDAEPRNGLRHHAPGPVYTPAQRPVPPETPSAGWNLRGQRLRCMVAH
jgi:hypothetical protein